MFNGFATTQIRKGANGIMSDNREEKEKAPVYQLL